ncbi:hypothetical protein EDD16DRAFT_434041 [Pisolithus croceorrhizus]|nr:hypothetical protein EDD16DRAFT_434041 [Pisolithus croceorrhizus]
MANLELRETIGTTVCNLWEECMRINWSFLQKGYVFDLLLTRDLSGGHVISFNAYAPHTDPLLLTYEEFHEVPCRAIQDVSAHRTLFLLELRVIESPLHPVATYSTPA